MVLDLLPPVALLASHMTACWYVLRGLWWLTSPASTSAQVFLFCANEKGASWAYATPGFGATLAPAHLKMLRQMAMPDLDESVKVCPPACTSLLPTVHASCMQDACSSGGLTCYHGQLLEDLAACPKCTFRKRPLPARSLNLRP